MTPHLTRPNSRCPHRAVAMHPASPAALSAARQSEAVPPASKTTRGSSRRPSPHENIIAESGNRHGRGAGDCGRGSGARGRIPRERRRRPEGARQRTTAWTSLNHDSDWVDASSLRPRVYDTSCVTLRALRTGDGSSAFMKKMALEIQMVRPGSAATPRLEWGETRSAQLAPRPAASGTRWRWNLRPISVVCLRERESIRIRRGG